MLRNSAEGGALAHVEPLVQRQDLERLICQHYQWAIETCRVDPKLVAVNGLELRGPTGTIGLLSLVNSRTRPFPNSPRTINYSVILVT
jgi:hypothetical protein